MAPEKNWLVSSKQLKTQKILFHPEKGLTLTAAVILKKTCFFQIQNICYETHGTEGSWSTQWMHITAVMAMSTAV